MLRIYIIKLCETVSLSVAVEVWKEYFRLLSELTLNREWKHQVSYPRTKTRKKWENLLRVGLFKEDWLKIKSAMKGDKGKYPIQIEQRGNETIITKTGLKNIHLVIFDRGMG